MNWRLTTLDGTGRECLSAPVPSREDAERWAHDLVAQGTHVVRITGPKDVTIEFDDVGSLERAGTATPAGTADV